jgi:nitrite reductase (cytochrome c-552)
MGIHYERGVSCADCHMPYKSEGNVKFTNHKIQSPLANISGSCIVCHRVSEAELMENVYERQDKIFELSKIAADGLVKAHIYAKACWDAGATEEQMKPILLLIRHSQWRWDYVSASHGGSFHAPLECARILGTSIAKSQEVIGLETTMLMGMGKQLPLIPDLSTKEKAQQYIGLDMQKIYQSKQEFINTVLPGWDKIAEERQGKLSTTYSK